MSFDVSVDTTAIPTDISTLKSFRDDLNLAFKLDPTLSLLLNATLSQVPSDKAMSSVSYTSPAISWQPAGPVTFGLQAGAAGTIEVVNGGDLIAYTDGLETQSRKSIPLPPNTVYVKLTLNFNLSGNASSNWSSGAYGVKASLDTGVTYSVTFCKAFAPSTKVSDAIGLTFTSFVLPFHKDTLAQMKSGDFLQHEFDGNLHLAFGAYVGLDRVLYAGQSSADVLQTAQSPLATFSVQASPEVRADVALDFTYEYAARFEALLSKIDGAARLHLFRSSKSTAQTVLSAGLKFDSNVTASIVGHQNMFAFTLVQAAGGETSLGGAALQSALAEASDEISKYVAEVNDKLTAWLNKANGIQTNLQVAIEDTRARTILAAYTFSMNDPGAFAQAWKAAVDGDFVAAFATHAVALDLGSGLEREYRQKTSCDLNVFNLWHWNSWSEFSSKMKLVYAGNNIFHLTADVGRTTETDSMGTMRSIELYFAAEADASATGALSALDINMHFILTATKQPKEAVRIAMLLGVLHAGSTADALSHAMRGFANGSGQGTAQLHVTVPMQAIRLINRDLPGSGSSVFDVANWKAFATAADDLNAWPLRQMATVPTQTLLFLKTYEAWEKLNMSCTGSNKPDRTQFGNRTQWPEDFPQVDTGSRALLGYSIFAGQSFMNFCAALHDLVRAVDVGSTGITWAAFMDALSDAVKNDTSVDFIRPTALAIVRLCTSSTMTVSGPSLAAIPADHFTVSVTL
jgi:hypothetical protein